MSATRRMTATSCRCKASVSRTKEPPAPRGANKVLAERNPAVVAVGAWVEGGQDFLEHPSALALLTEEIQAEKRRENEESLRRFQDEVRHRVAQQAQVSKKRWQPQMDSVMKPDRRTPQQQYQVWTQHVSDGETLMSAGGVAQQRVTERSSQESSGGMRQVRLRLAACRMISHGEMKSDLPGGEWNISPSTHVSRAGSRVLRAEQEEEEEEEEEEKDVQEEEEEEEEEDHYLFTSQHECPLVQQKVSGPVSWDADKSQPDPDFKSSLRVSQALWPLTNQEELKRQRQSQFLMHRRLYMNMEREQVKENKQNRKHLKRTARIKAEKEQSRLEEERKLERVRQLAEARQKLEERELLILERLKLEEEERAVELQRRRRREEKGKVAVRYVEALRAQMKERLSQEKLEPPPLCCCASSFWDSHPDTCANNCVFHNNPRAYAKALHSTLLSLEVQ
ncbi:coiled-coil domain-containing protein 15 isoform X2 [Epinephelus moara]|uniref:coiled-coil domain-containing protein 15 isoform X2 n=1 Tax=Epinephelus moara TaxID=300413 RepID=UPI00214EC9EC|nr:coiled-coil domain-containing protein 15 isoform X2 [Epinephelus moara]